MIIKQWDVLIHPYSDFIDDLAKPLFKVRASMSNHVPQKITEVLDHPCPNFGVSKKAPVCYKNMHGLVMNDFMVAISLLIYSCCPFT